MPPSAQTPEPEGKRLEEVSVEDTWAMYADRCLPDVETTGEFIRARLREAYYAGFGTSVVIAEKLGADAARALPIWQRFRAECEAADGRQTRHS